jgi:predicted alternative tryptophan synthase beta-subunit
VYVELDTRLKRVREVPRKNMKFNKANWENIKSDLQKVLEKIQLKNNDTRNTVDTLWNIFKTELITSIESNVPHK